MPIMLYFAYASNMWSAQMKERCPQSCFYSKAILHDYALCFPRTCEGRWGKGGVAGVCKAAGDRVEGVLYEVTEKDIAALDQFEGVEDGDYYREAVNVIDALGNDLEAWIYFANAQGEADFKPSVTYIDTLIKGASGYGLSESYLRRLKSYK